MNMDMFKNALDYMKTTGGNVYSQHKSWLWYVLAALVVFGGGYAAGRYGTPPNTVVTEKVKEVEKQVIVTQTKTEIQYVKIHDAQSSKKVHKVTTETTAPDGTKTKTTTEDEGDESKTHDDTKSDETQVKYVDRIVEKTVEKVVEKRVLSQPSWRVGAGVGLAIPYYLGQGSPGVPSLQGVVINVELDRRIIGPFFLGVHANSQGVLGLNLSGVF